MAQKIKLDFSKTEERSGWNTRHISEGLHKMKIDAVETTEAQDGTAMLVYALVPADARLKSRRFPYYCKLQQNQLWKLRDLLVAAGQNVTKKATSIDPSSVVGKFIAVEVADGTGQYAERSEVSGTYSLAILDEDGDAGQQDDEDEEGEEEEYEDSEEEADEEEESLEDMSIADLRTLAKSLGISTVKKTKDALIDEITDAEADAEEEEDLEDELDEDDLDDEELEDDEDFDDEEEDEEPAPKRRAAPAKTAPKAAAKRTVRRR